MIDVTLVMPLNNTIVILALMAKIEIFKKILAYAERATIRMIMTLFV